MAGRRVEPVFPKLYMPPGASDFACRACHNLTYESVKEHDKRVDFYLSYPGAIRAALGLKNWSKKLPAMIAGIRFLQIEERRNLPQNTRNKKSGPPVVIVSEPPPNSLWIRCP